MSIDNYETGFSGRNIWSEKGGTDMERHEVISIEEYLAKRKAKREQENHKEKELREDTDNKKTQEVSALVYYDMLSLESSLSWC